MTLATIEIAAPSEEQDYRIYVDVDDDGWAYLKQSDDWVAFPRERVAEIISALQRVGDPER